MTASFTAPVDSGARMSPMQAHAAALTFACRRSLMQVLGLATCDPDTDGGLLVHLEKVSDEQVFTIEDWLSKDGQDRPAFLRFMGVEKVGDIPADRFDFAVKNLRARVNG